MKYKIICSNPELLFTDGVQELISAYVFEKNKDFDIYMTEDDGMILVCENKPDDIIAGEIEIKFEEI
jgi:hypothetical protein